MAPIVIPDAILAWYRKLVARKCDDDAMWQVRETSMSAQYEPGTWRIDDYLAFERTADERHEYLDGSVYAMAGESPDHGRICMNLGARLTLQLDGSDCEAFSKDVKVRCGPMPRAQRSRQGLFAYPDLLVVCGPLAFHDEAREVLLNPTVIMEVLSPSTEKFDRGEKFQRYRTWLPTLQDYVLIAQDQPLIEHYHREDNEGWLLRTVRGLDAHLHLDSIHCTVALSDIYSRVVFPPRDEETDHDHLS